jgi:hypothetical protein
VNKVINDNETNDHITDFTGHFSNFEMVLHGFVFSTEHLSHFKISVGKEEVRCLIHAVGHFKTNVNHQVKVVPEIIGWIYWTLWIEIRIKMTPVSPIRQYPLGYLKKWADEQQSSNSVNVGELAMPISIYKHS